MDIYYGSLDCWTRPFRLGLAFEDTWLRGNIYPASLRTPAFDSAPFSHILRHLRLPPRTSLKYTVISMCTSKFFKGPTCEHTWAEIVTPCAEDRGFNTCPSFSDGKVRDKSGLKRSEAPEKSCPVCDKKGDYDGNRIRTIKSTTYGAVWGCHGASKTSPGCHFVLSKQEGFPKKRPSPEVYLCCALM